MVVFWDDPPPPLAGRRLSKGRGRSRGQEALWCGNNRAADVVAPGKLGIPAVPWDPTAGPPNGAAAVCAHLAVPLDPP